MATYSLCAPIALVPVLLNFLTVTLGTPDDLVISTTHGKVQGKWLSVQGGDVRAFLGIPYGKPPLGKLRFRAPEPVEKWEGVKDATKYPNSCYQVFDTAFPGRIHVGNNKFCIHRDSYLLYIYFSHLYRLSTTIQRPEV